MSAKKRAQTVWGVRRLGRWIATTAEHADAVPSTNLAWRAARFASEDEAVALARHVNDASPASCTRR